MASACRTGLALAKMGRSRRAVPERGNRRCRSPVDSENDRWQCCFCGETADLVGDTLLLTAYRKGHEPFQQLGTHADCLAQRLHQSTPFDAAMFAE